MKPVWAMSVVLLVCGAVYWLPPDDRGSPRPDSRCDVDAKKTGSVTKKENLVMGQFVIVCYRPKPGKEAALLELVRNHLPVLREQRLATDRPAYAMRAADGTIVEVFEWKSAKAVEEAHSNAVVLEMWKKFGEACDCDAIGNLAEAKNLFSSFEPVDLQR